jgi:hypothetical protein
MSYSGFSNREQLIPSHIPLPLHQDTQSQTNSNRMEAGRKFVRFGANLSLESTVCAKRGIWGFSPLYSRPPSGSERRSSTSKDHAEHASTGWNPDEHSSGFAQIRCYNRQFAQTADSGVTKPPSSTIILLPLDRDIDSAETA